MIIEITPSGTVYDQMEKASDVLQKAKTLHLSFQRRGFGEFSFISFEKIGVRLSNDKDSMLFKLKWNEPQTRLVCNDG